MKIALVLPFLVVLGCSRTPEKPAAPQTPAQPPVQTANSVPGANPSANGPQVPVLDGHDWQAANENMRAGMLDGMFDCLHFDKQDHRGPSGGLDDMIRAINRFYHNHDLNLPLETAYVGSKTASLGSGSDFGGESHIIQREDFSSVYWEGTREPQDQGFLLAYIACRTGKRIEPKPLQQLSEQVSSWYFRADVTEEESHTPIPVLLAKFGAVPRPIPEKK